MTRDLYEDFTERYDLAFGQFDKHDPLTVEFFRKLFTTNAVSTVLDCACGTGRHLRLFYSLGCEVFGSDLSESMLAQAKKNLTGCGIEVRLLCHADYRDLPRYFQRQYDTPFWTYSTARQLTN